jgi:mRNA-degrading endonuclease RelE of RelBE toxin-antitoxin system
MHNVVVSKTFARQFSALPKTAQRRIRTALVALGEDPLTPRSGADIKLLTATEPPKRRLRVGTYRLIYVVEGRIVKAIEVFARERGYRE